MTVELSTTTIGDPKFRRLVHSANIATANCKLQQFLIVSQKMYLHLNSTENTSFNRLDVEGLMVGIKSPSLSK